MFEFRIHGAMHQKSSFHLAHWLLFASVIMSLHLVSGESRTMKCLSGDPPIPKTLRNEPNPTHSMFKVSQSGKQKTTSPQQKLMKMLETLRQSELAKQAPRASTKYLKIAVLVEYNIYDKHFGRDLQKTLMGIQDLLYAVALDFIKMDVIVSLAGVIVWTRRTPNDFEMISDDGGRSQKQFVSYSTKSIFNHDHMVRLRGDPLVCDSCGRADVPKFSSLKTKPKTFRIRSELGNKLVLDIAGSNASAGAIVILQDPQNTTSQQWYIGGDMTIRSILNDYCLTSNGIEWHRLTMEPCGARRDNKWVYNYWTRKIQMANIGGSSCLQTPVLEDISPGASPLEKSCFKSYLDQSWRLEGEDGKETDSNILYSELYLTFSIWNNILGANRVLEASTDGSGLVIMTDSIPNSRSQKWYIATDKTIRSALNHNCLVSNGPPPAFSTLEKCDSRRDNKWIINRWHQRMEIATNSSKCLDVSRGKDSLGSKLVENDCNGKLNQEWMLDSEYSNCNHLDCESSSTDGTIFYMNQVP